MHSSTLAAILGLAGTGQALMKPIRAQFPGDKAATGTGTLAYFDQLIDHRQPELGTFKQGYYYNTDYYKVPGSPISMEAPTERELKPKDVALTNSSMTGFIAQNVGGAAVAIEHRYFGESTPVNHSDYSADTLQHLTLDNSLQDLVYFARNVKLPFDTEGLSHPDKAPWTLAGCSYPGAASAWTEHLYPGTYWAYEAGSAVVEARSDLWTWYKGIEQAMPRNCSADWKRIIGHIDNVYMNGSEDEKIQLRTNLGDDKNTTYPISAQGASSWLSYWQGQQYNDGYSPFFQWCDYIEGQYPDTQELYPGAEGVGLDKALENFFHAVKSLPPFPGSSLGDDVDPWLWFLCNEPFEWWQDDRPGEPFGMVTSYATREYLIDQVCGTSFPNQTNYGLASGKGAEGVNQRTGGWDQTNTTRLVWVNADQDPWLYATVSSPDRPGGPLESTDEAPVYMLRGAAHCNDFVTDNYWANEDARNMFDGVATYMQKWVAEFYEEKNITRPV
ncbi:hypothetical protein NLG97_g5640 [Lecanicillium saksenae]|uniref:Uncharacterized protein n=1 Tax=Lecanicillium saksenae TaxID=468837 RepID=A0ACC1QTM0_9HYPO|nr:hypothetical protein NLG97_g5640 [Lecanicillium saksenae]